MPYLRWRETALGIGGLFLSAATLLCCALPILLVSLGLGALAAGLVGEWPWLVTLSRYKAWLFGITALLLATGGWAIYRAGRHCPADPVLARACAQADRWNRRIWWLAIGVWSTGAFMAYLWLPLRKLAGF